MAKSKKRVVSKLAEYDQVRFGAVGALNTTVDFAVLFFLSMGLGLPVIVANIGSTSVALGVSYLLNKKVVFMDAGKHNLRQVMQFVVVTLFGLWVLQGIMLLATPTALWLFFNPTDSMTLLISKIAATAVSLMWNYWWYSRVVFKKAKA